MTGDVTINSYDAFTRYGINFEDGALSALMTPPPLKEFIESKSRLRHGKTVITKQPKYDSREITMPFHIVASSRTDFLEKYNLFCSEVLANGAFTLSTKYQPQYTKTVNGVAVTVPRVVYHLVYQSCSQFRQYQREMAVFSLKVIEPDPTDRTEHVATPNT